MSRDTRSNGGTRQTLTEGAIKAGNGQYLFNLDELGGLDAGPTYSTAHGPVIEGERMQVGLMHMSAGTSADLHTHPNEQFMYILDGSARFRIADQEETQSEGTLVYIPSGVEHAAEILDEDLYFYVVKDLRHGIAGTRVDEEPAGRPSRPSDSDTTDKGHDRETKTDGAIKAGSGRYFFDLDELAGIDAGPTYSTAHGAVVEGERIQVGLMHMPSGSGSELHTHPNEQFNYRLQGTSRFFIDGQELRSPPGTLTHIPPNTDHRGEVVGDEDVYFFVAKDLSHGIAGTRVDR